MKTILCSIAALGLLAYAAPASAGAVCDNVEDKKCPSECPEDPDCPPVCTPSPGTCDPTCPDDPDCKPTGGADCSPGFYKNHVEAWCGGPLTTVVPCPNTTQTLTCQDLVCLLSAEGGPGCSFKANSTQRAFAKACLDALSSPAICED